MKILPLLCVAYIRAKMMRLTACGKMDFEFTDIHRNKRLVSSELARFSNLTHIECYHACSRHNKCKSVNFHRTLGCELNSNEEHEESGFLIDAPGWSFVQSPKSQEKLGAVCRLKNPCWAGTCRDTCDPPGFKCTCPENHSGEICSTQSGKYIMFRDKSSDAEDYPHIQFTFPESTTGFTMSGWFQADSFVDHQAIFSMFTPSENPLKFACNRPLISMKGNTLSVRIKDDDVAQTTIDLGEQYHLSFSISGNNGSFYVNGDLIDTFHSPDNFITTGETFIIAVGCDADLNFQDGECVFPEKPFHGTVNQVRVYSFCLAAEEIQQIYMGKRYFDDYQVVSWDQFLQYITDKNPELPTIHDYKFDYTKWKFVRK